MEHYLTECPGCEDGTVEMVEAFSGGAVDYDFICSDGCDWHCADAGRAKRARQQRAKKLPRKKHQGVKFQPDSPELVQAIRDEINRRMKILAVERAKCPPSLIKKGKRWVSNPKFTEKMRQHMHSFAVSPEQIREEFVNA